MLSSFESRRTARACLPPCAAWIACGFALLACSPNSPSAQSSPTTHAERLLLGEEADPNTPDPSVPNAITDTPAETSDAAEPAAAVPVPTSDSDAPPRGIGAAASFCWPG
jgi:hypothetical protein